MFIDIAVNIADKEFLKHDGIEDVMMRSMGHKVIPILIGSDQESSEFCMRMAREYSTVSTIGIHPTCSSNSPSIDFISEFIDDDSVVAIGECGLDYDRIEFSDKTSQKEVFRSQLDLNGDCYFLHSRSCHRDFMEMICDYRIRGVVHSFTGALEEAEELIKKGFYIGINGCSTKTPSGIDVIRNLPLDSVLIETDSPYCKVRKSYSGYEYIDTDFSQMKVLKRRNEPCCVVQMVEIISNITNVDHDVVMNMTFNNTLDLFGDKLRSVVDKWR